jgi:hypothetical protein
VTRPSLPSRDPSTPFTIPPGEGRNGNPFVMVARLSRADPWAGPRPCPGAEIQLWAPRLPRRI